MLKSRFARLFISLVFGPVLKAEVLETGEMLSASSFWNREGESKGLLCDNSLESL